MAIIEKAAEWDPVEESTLFNYVMSNGIVDNKINWYGIQALLLTCSVSQRLFFSLCL